MTEIKLVTNIEHAKELGRRLDVATFASLDIETTPVPWYTDEYKLLSVAISLEPGVAYVIPVDHAESPCDGHFLLDIVLHQYGPPRWVMQNGSFDWVALRSQGHMLPPLWHDTLAIQYLLDINLPKSLEDLAKRWLGVDGWKDIDYKHPEEEDLMTLLTLNGRDADYTLQVFHAMQPVMADQCKLERVYLELLRPAMATLARMEISGIPIDLDRLADLTATVENRLDTTLESIQEMVNDNKFNKFNPNSYKQMQKLLYGDLGLPVFVFTDKGAPSTNKEALHKLENMHPVISLIQRFRTDRKLLTASLLPWAEHADSRGWLHPRYKPAHVRTGRLASEMPNIQQVPRDPEVRRLFGGVEGYQFVEVDYSQLELRIVAELAQEENMLAAFHAGEDLHQTTADALGVDRQTGKTANFGLLYGAGYRKLRQIAEEEYGVVLSERQAIQLREAWFKAYPAIETYHNTCLKEAKATGIITTALGRQRPLPDIYSSDYAKEGGAARQAMNTPVQGLASDITLLMLNELQKDFIEGRMKAQPVATVHDSILFLVPNDCLVNDVDHIQERMEHPPLEKYGIELGVPLLTDVKQGNYWSNE